MAVPAPSSWLFAPGQDQNDDKKAEQEEECAETLASPAGVCRRTRHAGASTRPRNRHGRPSSTSVAAASVVVALKPPSFEPKPSSNPSFLLPNCSNAPLVCSRNGGDDEGAERPYWTGTTDDSVDAQNGDGALSPFPFNPNPKPDPNHSLPLPDFSRALLVCGRDGGEEDADRLKWTGSASDLVDVRNGDDALNPNPSSNSNPIPDPNPNPSLTPSELSKGLLVFGREEGEKVEEMGAEEGSGDLSSDEAPKQQGKRSKLDNGKAIMRSRQPEYATNHCMAERKRREKLNNQFQALKDLIRPYIRSKDDKASLLGDTIEYIKELQRRVYEKENTPCTCQGQYPTKSETIDITRLDTVPSEGLRAEKAGGYLSEPLDNKKDAAIKGDNGPTIEVRGMEDDLVMIKIVCMDRPGLFRDLMQAIHELKLQVQYANVNTNAGIVHQVIHAKVDSTKEQHANQLVADSFRCAVLKASGVTK